MSRRGVFLALGIAATAAAYILLFSGRLPHTNSRTYYVDAHNGSDAHNGNTPQTAWQTLERVNRQPLQPGDSVLFKTGGCWQGQLRPTGSGTLQAPIVISSYGEARKPGLHGNGQVEQVILLDEVDHYEISGLEISNRADSTGNRTGVLIRSLEPVNRRHFRLRNLHVHHVMGDYSFKMKGKNTGGIGIIGGPETKLDDILIEDCEIGHINRVGIFTNLTDTRNATRGNRPISRLVIRNNRIHHCTGDGVIVRFANQPLIERNVVYENHCGDEALVEHGVALWCRSTDEAVFQYNEVFRTRGSMDGQAFDADLDAYRTIVQYNYSYENEGGFMLVYGSSSDAIVRHNISVNDGKKGKHIFDFPVWTKPRGSGRFHNNTIIIGPGNEAVIADEALPSAVFYNNIFFRQETGRLFIPWEGQTATFLHNQYSGYTPSDVPDPQAVFALPAFAGGSASPTPGRILLFTLYRHYSGRQGTGTPPAAVFPGMGAAYLP